MVTIRGVDPNLKVGGGDRGPIYIYIYICMFRGVDPVLKVGGGGDGGPIYIYVYVCILYVPI